ncbi:MAG: hypothetical protein MUO54_10525 [Anaerolineales bacterium]|nr:hypothetical protein [Anaerolineales bacterium]
MMKKLGLLIVVMLLLTACGSNSSDIQEVNYVGEAAVESSSGENREELRADFADNALSPALQLVVGTLMLEDTGLVVDIELAATLVPYWKLYITLTESDTTAPEELDALINEIQEIMSPDQINYIAGLELTQEDMMTLNNDLGIIEQLGSDGFGNGEGTGFDRPDGMPEGVGPGGGQGRPGGTEGMDPELIATMEARREELGSGGFRGNRMTIPLVEALITLLEEKVNS